MIVSAIPHAKGWGGKNSRDQVTEIELRKGAKNRDTHAGGLETIVFKSLLLEPVPIFDRALDYYQYVRNVTIDWNII